MPPPPEVFEQLKGVNYVVNTMQARDHIQAMLNPDRERRTMDVPGQPRLRYPAGAAAGPFFGQFDRDLVGQELLGLGHDVNFDSIRIYPTFFAWLLNRHDYLANLADIARTCRAVGLKITFVVWGASLAKRVLFDEVERALGGIPAGRFTPEQVVKFFTDVWHDSKYPGGSFVPLEGTFFELYQWGDLPASLVTTEPDWHRWNAGFPELNQEVQRRLAGVVLLPGGGIGDAIDLYLTDIGSFFADAEGGGAFLSYDLFNEIDVLTADQGSLDNALTLVEATMDRLLRVHPEAVFTVGLASGHNVWPFYSMLEMRRPRAIHYASFHDFSPALYGHDPRGLLRAILDARKRLEDLRQGAFPFVCSEFYTPYVSPDRSPYGHARGNLAGIIDTLTRNRIGGQIWSMFETNVTHQAPLGSGKTGVVPNDGLFVPRDRDTGFDWSWNSGRRVLDFVGGARVWAGFEDDFRSLLRWTGVLP